MVLGMSTQTYSQRVAGEVRAELARQGKTANDMAVWLGVSRPTARSRYSGETTYQLDELVTLSSRLNAPLGRLLLLAPAPTP
uniref:HTH cro/C1-type domain-containing protein n=1 Tax=Dulem virus 32 TaxID=3145750 RepID=A0AAU8B0H9_9CAUD